VFRGITLFKARQGQGRWNLLLVGLEVGAVAALVASLVLAAKAHGEWSPADLLQVTLGLALVVLGFHLELVFFPRLPYPRLHRIGETGLFVDLVVLGLVLAAVFAVQPGGALLLCVQRMAMFYSQWILHLLGVGALVVGGCTGLTLALYRMLALRRPDLPLPQSTTVSGLMGQSTLLALLLLGSGLVVSIWWAWLTIGRLTGGDPRDVWMGIAWLVAASSWLAWKLEQEAGRWTAGLTVLAAATAVFGLLAMPDLYRLLGQ
jgi:hypothetical protein